MTPPDVGRSWSVRTAQPEDASGIHNDVIGFVVALPWNHPALGFERNPLTMVAWSGESYADPSHPLFRDAILVDDAGIDPLLSAILSLGY